MSKARNILWIMCDQLRFDYLGCAGHPTLKTPNIDRLAARGVRFTNAYVQSTICGPSRMSAYTGRYMRSHGSTQNGVPLRVGVTEAQLGMLVDCGLGSGLRFFASLPEHLQGFQLEGSGLAPTLLSGMVCIDRFRLDRRLWASLRDWRQPIMRSEAVLE